jgi:hypothetical protein
MVRGERGTHQLGGEKPTSHVELATIRGVLQTLAEDAQVIFSSDSHASMFARRLYLHQGGSEMHLIELAAATGGLSRANIFLFSSHGDARG